MFPSCHPLDHDDVVAEFQDFFCFGLNELLNKESVDSWLETQLRSRHVTDMHVYIHQYFVFKVSDS